MPGLRSVSKDLADFGSPFPLEVLGSVLAIIMSIIIGVFLRHWVVRRWIGRAIGPQSKHIRLVLQLNWALMGLELDDQCFENLLLLVLIPEQRIRYSLGIHV